MYKYRYTCRIERARFPCCRIELPDFSDSVVAGLSVRGSAAGGSNSRSASARADSARAEFRSRWIDDVNDVKDYGRRRIDPNSCEAQATASRLCDGSSLRRPAKRTLSRYKLGCRTLGPYAAEEEGRRPRPAGEGLREAPLAVGHTTHAVRADNQVRHPVQVQVRQQQAHPPCGVT
eukprot:26928-Prorocentrum_minimum.AAC.1